MKSFQVLLLDFDGTIADTGPAIAHSMRQAFAAHGAALPETSDVLAYVGAPLPAMITALRPGLAVDAVTALAETYRTIYREEGLALMRLFPGIQETLEEARRLGARLAVASNKKHEALGLSVRQLGMEALFEVVAGLESAGPVKPERAFFDTRIQPWFKEVPLSELLVVGDAEPDLALARNIGAAACWVTWGLGDPVRCAAYVPEYVLSEPGDLLSLV